MTYYSQDRQDYNLENYVFKGYKNGFFVDIGAYDGKTINNTLFFEENHNWSGINIEPIPKIFEQLKNNRPKCINLNIAVDDNDGETEFCCNDVLSGIKEYYDPRHINRINNEREDHNYEKEIIKVTTKRLDTILKEYNIKHINYLSIDVEGAEWQVINSINFDEVFIDVIGFENNYPDSSIHIIEYLKQKDYYIFYKGLDIFMIHNKSIFTKNF
jgi:FkbM family methyltransferase